MKHASSRLIATALLCLVPGCASDEPPEASGDDASTATTAASDGGVTTAQDRPGTSPSDEFKVVEIKNLAFNPPSVTVAPGDSVTWRWNDGATRHSVVGTVPGFNGPVASFGQFTFTFQEPGTYDYSCTVHPSMRGTVIVRSSG